LRLVLNDSLAARDHFEQPRHNEQKLAQTRIVRVRVTGATVKLIDTADRVVAMRQIGTTVLTGCTGPDRVSLVVREPARYRLAVRYADGASAERRVDLTKTGSDRLVKIEVTRPD